MIVAVTYENEKVFQHFGHTKQLKIYDIEDNNIKQERIIEVNENGHGELVELLSNNEVQILICGGIGSGAKEGLEKANIKFYSGVLGDADNAVKNLLNKKLKYNENAHCEYHEHNEHSCNEHKCNEDKHGCSGNEEE